MNVNKTFANALIRIVRAKEFIKKNSISIGAVALAGFAAVSMTACNANIKEDISTPQVAYVQVEKVKAKSMDSLSELSGTLEPTEEATVSFEASGTVESVGIQEGSRVNAGEILASIDSESYSLQTQQAANQILNTETAYNQAATDFKRFEILYSEGAISKSDYEKAKINMDIAQNNMSAAYLAKQQTELVLSKTSLESPLNGVVLAKYISAGQLVSAGTPAYRIGNIDRLKVGLLVPDNEISSWKIGDKILVKLYEESVEGEVANIFPATNENTGGITVEVAVNNADHKWHSGQVVTCVHISDSKAAIYVPKEAVISSGGTSAYVFILADDKAVKTEVTIGILRNNLFEIKSGIRENDRVIVKGADRLSDGDKVRVIGSDKQ